MNEHWENQFQARGHDKALDKALQNLDKAIQESGVKYYPRNTAGRMGEEIPMTLLFQNLIGNAIKYRRAGASPKIHIRPTNRMALSSFRSPTTASALTTSIWTRSSRRSSGCMERKTIPAAVSGLAIAKKIVERAGGRIWAESDGHGSVFHFTIPAKDGELMNPANIVLIEDNPADVLLIELALKENGIIYKLTRYANGEDAVRSLCDSEAAVNPLPDAILLDLNTPRSDGFQVLIKFKKSPRFANVPIAIITSSRATSDQHRSQLQDTRLS